MERHRVVLAGGSGFLGQTLAAWLAQQSFDVVVLTRSPQRHTGLGTAVPWDAATPGRWADTLEGARAVVNLSGKPIYRAASQEARQEIVRSRVDSVRVVAEAVRRCRTPPRCLVQVSAVGYYGDAGERVCDESAPPGSGFMAETCVRWEEALAASPTPGTRRVLLRLGIVLGSRGGALAILAALTRWFLGGRAGSGRQYVSWLHADDACRMFLEAITREEISGTYNATSPHPVTNAEFMRHLRAVLHRPWSPPAPAWAVRAGAWLAGVDPSLALSGQRAVPTRWLQQGFSFTQPELRPALEDLLHT